MSSDDEDLPENHFTSNCESTHESRRDQLKQKHAKEQKK
jgi:hypothetical protein